MHPVHITDTTLRDAHQSMWATRMRTDDILGIIDEIDKVGYYSLEVWGGATFDVCLRFLRENPWERLRKIKERAKRTPLQMLLRGQNLVGYRNYPDDVLDRFVALAHENGIDIFRIFDALNDTRNLEAAIKAVKRHGAHAQGTLAYTISPVHTPEKYVEYAKAQVDLGIDSLVIKDMAGILSPVGAEKLVSKLVKEIDVPIQLHAHATSGMATAMYLSGVRAGAGAIDCAISSMAGFTAQPPAETLAAIFEETEFACHLDFEALGKVAKYFEELKPKRQLKSAPSSVVDPGILVHQIPGGMISNFRSQLEQQGALDKLDLALEEVTKVRKELGYPPLVTPTSQIVGTQAVMNVLSGERYKIIPNEVKDYLRGFYGRSPAAIDPKFYKSILGDEKPIDYRPADKLEPMLPTATHGLDAKYIELEEDIISYCIFPEPALEYFKWRSQPEGQKDAIPADLEMEAAKSTATVNPPKAQAPAAAKTSGMHPDQMMHIEDYRGMALLLNKAAGLKIDEFSIRKADFRMSLRSGGGTAVSIDMDDDLPEVPPVTAKAVEETPVESAPASAAPVEDQAEYSHVVVAPLVGTFYSSSGPGKEAFVKIGDTVSANEKVCIVEAMKLFNEIVAPENCKIVKILANDGDNVKKGQALVAYEPA
ncbi:pyruvate carboxylase subunit B [bacterium]|nr:pyruvate carboxylase subunit B [bacterium]